MYIDLHWANLNSEVVKLEIFRGDAPLDRQNLPDTPIATLTQGETQYRDADTELVAGKTYYYVFVVSNDYDRDVSQNFTVTALSRRGPGPQALLQGDNGLGYFGSLTSGEFISGSELLSRTAFSANLLSPYPTWHKYVRNNKVLYVPDGPIGYNVTWTDLYNAGLVYGRDDKGGNSLISLNVNQGKKVTIGLDTFRVRLLKGTIEEENYTTFPPVANHPFAAEYDDLVFPLVHPVPDNQRLDNVALNGKKAYVDFMKSTSLAVTILCQELMTSVNCVARGSGSAVASNIDDTTSDTSGIYSPKFSSGYTRTGAGLWYPVLELMETN